MCFDLSFPTVPCSRIISNPWEKNLEISWNNHLRCIFYLVIFDSGKIQESQQHWLIHSVLQVMILMWCKQFIIKTMEHKQLERQQLHPMMSPLFWDYDLDFKMYWTPLTLPNQHRKIVKVRGFHWPPPQTPTQKFKNGFSRCSCKEINSSLISFKMIFESL